MEEIKNGNNRFKIMTVFGILLLVLYFIASGFVPSSDGALEARCRAEITRRGGELVGRIDQCREKAFAAIMTATEARSAAREASGANQTEVLVHAASMFALGMGAVLTIIGLLGWFGIIKQRRKNA